MLKHDTKRTLSPGKAYPLGASLQEGGVNFAVYSEHGAEMFLLLFDSPDGPPTDVIRLDNWTRYIRHIFVHGVGPGQLYGYKARGNFDPGKGLYFNEHKLLIDPYAKAVTGKARNTDNLLLPYEALSPDRPFVMDVRDNTHLVPKAIVVDDAFDWQGDGPLDLPFERLIIYEVHVKGFTAHPSSGVASPGTYSGFIEKIPYLKKLGVNAVEFLPIHEFFVDDFLISKGLTNYWGYNTVCFFAPESSYGTGSALGCQVAEFKALVRELHKAGIEVILDVVYNHTAEGNEYGPSLGMKGLDNPTYYALTGTPDKPLRYYMNWTGCGNSMDLSKPAVIRLVMDSLRYWVSEMHVDGFRFDLASVLGREDGRFRGAASFFDAISQDPLLCRVKLIAEPWDLGAYEVGNFPVDWAEWNGRFRDTIRKIIKGDAGQMADLGWRVTGSYDLYGDDGRSAFNSINFVTCHDGFTLHDLLSYNVKHNDANLENNRDGSDDNNSWNCGAEGTTGDAAILRLRKQLAKNFFCVLIFSAGTPMVLGGDEFLRTQQGNNNAYCQDNGISWFDWGLVEQNRDMVGFFRKTIEFTRRYTILQRRKFFLGRDLNADSIPDLTWYGPDGNAPAWGDASRKTLCLRIDGGEEKSEIGDYQLFIILNCEHVPRDITLPAPGGTRRWRRVIDTSLDAEKDFLGPGLEIVIDPPGHYLANGRSVVVLLGK